MMIHISGYFTYPVMVWPRCSQISEGPLYVCNMLNITVCMSGCNDRDSVLPHLVDAVVSVALFWCILGGFPSFVVADLSNMGTCSYNRSVCTLLMGTYQLKVLECWCK